MKYLKPNEYVYTLIQFSLPLAIYLGFTASATWPWWVLSFFMFLLYTIVGNNIALHRYYSHNEFKVSKVSQRLFAWLTLTLCIGSPASYATLHITHHIHPSSGPDWTWRDLPFYRHIWFNEDTIQPYKGKRIVQLYKQHPLIHDYNLGLIALYALALYLINYKLFLFFWFVPVTVSMWEIALAVYFQHRQAATNSPWHWLFPTWEGLHANHHDYPGVSNNAREAGQIDYTFLISKLFVRK
jgi:fatty-acid desaturase